MLTGSRRKLSWPHGHLNYLVKNTFATLLGFLHPQVHMHSHTWCQVCNKNKPIITFHLIMQMQKHQGGMQHNLAFVKESQFGGSIIHHTSYDHY